MSRLRGSQWARFRVSQNARELLLPCGFLPESKEPELQPATPACRPQTHSRKELVVDPGECLSEEEEEWRLPQVSISPTVKFSADGTLPAQSSSANPAVAKPVHSPAKNLPVVGESSLVYDAVDPSLLSMEEDVSGGSEKENGEYLPEPKEVIAPPETLPPEKDVELGGSEETSPNLAITSPRAAETTVAVTNYEEGNDLDVVDPVQCICRSSRQRQPPQQFG
ncbi:hypothetical protein ABVT39_015715 [Epinephelus coioides]